MPFRRLRLLILFLAAAWLPFSAVAAVAMPFCTHGPQGGDAPAGIAAGHDGHWSQGDCHGAASGADPAGVQGGMACDQCGFCHLACAGMIPSEAKAAPGHPAGHVLAGLAATLHSDPLPERLRRPPRSA